MGLKYKFDEGVMWDDIPFILSIDEEIEREDDEPAPCRHCRDSGATKLDRKIWICPTVVIAKNEGGHNSTGVCLNCILDGAKSVGIALQS
jgi:ribosomal protein L37AE/L43A